MASKIGEIVLGFITFYAYLSIIIEILTFLKLKSILGSIWNETVKNLGELIKSLPVESLQRCASLALGWRSVGRVENFQRIQVQGSLQAHTSHLDRIVKRSNKLKETSSKEYSVRDWTQKALQWKVENSLRQPEAALADCLNLASSKAAAFLACWELFLI